MKRQFKILSFLLIFSLLAGCLPVKEGKSKAATANLTCETKNGISYANTADEALNIMEKQGGGKITVNTSMAWTTNTVRTMYAHTKIIVPQGVTMTIEGAGMKGEGAFEVSGTLDLKNSTCDTFHVTGTYEVKGSGSIVRQYTNIGSLLKSSDTAAVLTYGQKLPKDAIDDSLIGLRVYRDGGWYFRDLTTVYGVGVHNVTVFYDYKKMIYTPHDVEETVQIRVDKADPKMSQYTIPEVEHGQTISTIQPKYSFTNPNSGEAVAGTLQFSNGTTVLKGTGEKQLQASFVPNNSKNYNSLPLSLKVNVVKATPKVAVTPYVGKGQYGQALKNISLQQGSCVNSHTGELISGSWAWKNTNTSLICGEHTYPAIFTPTDTTNYKSVETMVSVQTLPKKMTSVSWPTVSAINEGQHLSEAALSFTSNEYGTFSWEDATRIPLLESPTDVLVFAPCDTENYDWTDVAGYDAQTKTVKKTISLSVIPKPTEPPKPTEVPKPTETLKPTEIPKPTESSKPTEAVQPTEVPTVTDVPNSTGNPNSTYIPKPTETSMASAAPTAPSDSEKPQMTPGALGSTAPVPTAVPTITPTIIPTVMPTASALPTETPGSTADVSPLPTEGTVPDEKLEQTPEPVNSFEPYETKQPDGSNVNSGNHVGDSAGDSTNQPAATQKPDEIEEPVVVKKVITKISSIKTPKGAALKKNSRIKSVKRRGKTVKIVLKKVKKAKYEVRYSTRKNMKHAKKKRSSKRIIYIRKLKKNKKYYLQARAWKKKKGKKIYGKWSKKRKI